MMTRFIPLALAVAAVARAQPAPAPYAREARVAYLASALDAMRALGGAGRTELERALYQGARASCRAALATPSIGCTIDVAHAACDPRPDAAACLVAADVILVNQRAENEWLDDATRMQLVGASTDYHTALLAELDVEHGALAAELALAEPRALTGPTLPARIDRFCAYRERGPDWQRCAAALVWYIGNREGPP
jgi:hypothetical protein